MKEKRYSISVLGNKQVIQEKNVDFYTTDNDAWLIFKVADTTLNPETATITLINLNDKSVVSESVVVENKTIRYHMRPEIIEHAGVWRIQLIFDEGRNDYTSAIINLQVHGHLKDDKEPALEIIDNWNTFMRQAEDFMIEIDDQLHELPSYQARIATLETRKADKTEVNELASKKADKTYVDEEDAKLTAQLAHKANVGRVNSYNSEPQNLTLSGGNGDLKPFVSFVDDDGKSNAYSTLYPLFKSKGIVGTVAITVDRIDTTSDYMTKDNLVELQENGWEVASHNYSDVYFNSDDLTLDEIEYQVRKSKEVLSEWGLAVNNYVYTGGQTGKQGRSETFRIIKKYYRSAYNTNPLQNKSIDNYHWINRVNGDMGTLSSLKAEVDKCLAEDNWLIFMLHSGTHNAERTQIISDLIDYIKSKNIGIGTLNDGLDIFGSSFNVGSKETITVRNDGEIHGTGIGSVFRHPYEGYDIDENTPLYRFEPNKVTYSYIRTSNGISMPSPVNEGVLTTYHFGRLGLSSSCQTWVQYNREAVYKRKWNGTFTEGEWGEWQTDTFNVTTPNLAFKAYETRVVDIDISKAGGGLTNQTPIVATCRNPVIDNFSYNIRIDSPTTAKLRITNLTDNPSGNDLVLYSSDWDIKVFRK